MYYNRFRYYSPDTGTYISQDPISIAGGLNVYAYVHDSNSWIDVLGLTGTYMFTDGKTWYIGKGPEERMYASMKERVGGKANVTQGIHVDYGNNQTGLMVEAELMRRKNAVADPNFKNAINSPGEKLLADAQKNNKTLYNDIIQKADDFETKFKMNARIYTHNSYIYLIHNYLQANLFVAITCCNSVNSGGFLGINTDIH